MSISIARNFVAGVSMFEKCGHNTDIDTGAPADIWDGLGLYTGFPATSVTPETISVVSTSANDDLGGSGAEIVRLEGLGANWETQTEDVTLNGTTPVVTSNTWRRMYRAYVIQSANGANTSFNAGVISAAYTTTTSVIFMKMQAGISRSRQCVFTVPAGQSLIVTRFVVSVDRTNSAFVTGNFYRKTQGLAPEYIRYFHASNDHDAICDVNGSLVFPEMTDVSMRVLTSSANNLPVSANLQGVLVPGIK